MPFCITIIDIHDFVVQISRVAQGPDPLDHPSPSIQRGWSQIPLHNFKPSSFIHSHIQINIHSSIHAFTTFFHPFTHSKPSFIHHTYKLTFIHPFTHTKNSLIHSQKPLFISIHTYKTFIHPFTHTKKSFIHSLTHTKTYLLFHYFKWCNLHDFGLPLSLNLTS